MGTSKTQVVKIVLFLGARLVGRKFKPGSYKLARLLPTRLISCNNILSGSELDGDRIGRDITTDGNFFFYVWFYVPMS